MLKYDNMARTKPAGTLIISLDFELMWGMFDKVTPATYGANLAGTHTAVPKLLELFTEHHIHATWATVGMLTHQAAADLNESLQEVPVKPTYQNPTFSAYDHWRALTATHTEAHYFAPHLVALITATPNQEFASHTFSHYYCREAQVDAIQAREAFKADCAAFKAATPTGVHVSSMVFPRNQWTNAALATLASFGFTAFRGTEEHFLYRARTDAVQNNPFIRLLRLLDHYINLSGYHTYAQSAALVHESGLVNLPASRFLRPWSARLAFLEPLRLRRIKNVMTHAAKRGEVFHLWWHPHNFGVNQDENLKVLQNILKHFAYLQTTYRMESCTMAEAATRVAAPLAPTPLVAEGPV